MSRSLIAATDKAVVAPIWRGHSGRLYPLVAESCAKFSVAGEALHLVTAGGRALWVGTEADLITDSASRARFRSALRRCEGAYRYEVAEDAATRMITAIDLENGTLYAPDTVAQTG